MLRTTRPFRVSLSLALCALAVTPWLASAQQIAGLRAYELDASKITLPPTDPGILTALPCGSCRALSFSTAVTTRYRVGEQFVTLAELRAQFAEHPKAFVVVVMGDDLKTVDRVTMSAPAITE